MEVVVFRHIGIEHLGSIATVLDSTDILYHYVDLCGDPKAKHALDDCDGLIFMGGPMSANDNLSFIRRELEILESWLKTGKPVLGICLGAQLLARALGANVHPNAVKEIGWAPVHLTDVGFHDPLLSAFRESETVLHRHGETFDLPPGAELLASSEHCRHQAFRYRRNVYGLQFHLEATPSMIRRWCAADVNQADLATLSEPIDPEANRHRMAELSAHVFGAWTRLLTGE